MAKCTGDKWFRWRFRDDAVIWIAADWPDLHTVPSASCSTADHTPLAHCWNDVVLMQFHSPSVEQAVPAAMAAPVPVVEVVLEGWTTAGLTSAMVSPLLTAAALGVVVGAAEVVDGVGA